MRLLIAPRRGRAHPGGEGRDLLGVVRGVRSGVGGEVLRRRVRDLGEHSVEKAAGQRERRPARGRAGHLDARSGRGEAPEQGGLAPSGAGDHQREAMTESPSPHAVADRPGCPLAGHRPAED